MRDLSDEAIDAHQARMLGVFGPAILDPDDVYTEPCECGETGEHTCDPATVRMDTSDTMPIEPEPVR